MATGVSSGKWDPSDFFCRAAQDILEEAPLEVESLAKKCCFLGLLQAAVQYGFPEQSFS